MRVERPCGTAPKGRFSAPTTDQDAIEEKYSFASKVVTEMQRIGITEPERPVFHSEHLTIFPGVENGQYFDGRMPLVVKGMSLQELGTLYHLFQCWYAYLMYQYSVWKVRTSEAERKRSVLTTLLQKKYGESQSVEKAKTEAKADSRYVEVDAEFETAKAMSDVLDCQIKITSKSMSMISRTITIKEAEVEQNAQSRGFYGKMSRVSRVGMKHEDESGEDNPAADTSEEQPAEDIPPRIKPRVVLPGGTVSVRLTAKRE